MEPNTAPVVREHHIHQRHFDRLVMLADGVFAIALTLSAVELRPEAKPGQTLLQVWGAPLLVYFLSFYLIAGVWYQHRRAMAQLRRIDAPLTVLTMLLLSLVALVPVLIRNMITGGILFEVPLGPGVHAMITGGSLPDTLSAGGAGLAHVPVYAFSMNGFVPYVLVMLMIQCCLTMAWGYAAFIARLAPDLLPTHAMAWLLHDLFLTMIWAMLAVWGLSMPWLAVILLAVVVALRIAEGRMRRTATAAEG